MIDYTTISALVQEGEDYQTAHVWAELCRESAAEEFVRSD